MIYCSLMAYSSLLGIVILFLKISIYYADNNVVVSYREYNPDSRHVCSENFGRPGDKICREAFIDYKQGIHLEKIGHGIINALEKIDGNNLVRRVYLARYDDPSITSDAMGIIIDKFLDFRLWWMVQIEMKSEHIGINNDFPKSRRILLLRFGQVWENILMRFSKTQFPPQYVCERTPLRMMSMVNSGWGSQMDMYSGRFLSDQNFVAVIWDTLTNRFDEPVQYVTTTTCPDVINKRLCAFIRMSNCTLPTFLTSVSSQNSHHVRSQIWYRGDFMSYTNASAIGLPRRGKHEKNVNIPPFTPLPYHQRLGTEYPETNTQLLRDTFYDGRGVEVHKDHRICNPNIKVVLSQETLFMRLNARYRAFTEARIRAFRDKECGGKFPTGTQCVAIHIRRGDRIFEGGTDMNAYCRNVIDYGNGTCLDRRNQKPTLCKYDKGCEGLKPFGGISLQEYLDKAALVAPQIKNVFVLTDDGEWLKNESSSIQPGWNIFTLASLPHKDQVSLARWHASPRATENGVDFFASVALARQCQGFVGHFGSAVSRLVYHAMCYQYDNYIGRCPKACDAGNAY